MSHALDFRKPKKKKLIKDNNCSRLPGGMLLLKAIKCYRIAWDFSTLLRLKQGQVCKLIFENDAIPMTLTSGAFVNKKCNKQTSHELQNNLDSSCISFCTPSRKRQFKTSQDEKKLCQLQLSVRGEEKTWTRGPWTPALDRVHGPLSWTGSMDPLSWTGSMDSFF